MAAGITNPVLLSNPGWGIFARGLAATTGSSAADFADAADAIVIGNDGRTIINGFLNDTFVDFSQGVMLFCNEIALLLDATEVPEPASLALVALGIAGISLRRRSRSRRPSFAKIPALLAKVLRLLCGQPAGCRDAPRALACQADRAQVAMHFSRSTASAMNWLANDRISGTTFRPWHRIVTSKVNRILFG